MQYVFVVLQLCEEDVVLLVFTRRRRSLLIFLKHIYLQSLPVCLPLSLFSFFLSIGGFLMINAAGQMNGSVNQVNISSFSLIQKQNFTLAEF